jgi:hypothetical protein
MNCGDGANNKCSHTIWPWNTKFLVKRIINKTQSTGECHFNNLVSRLQPSGIKYL